MWTIEDIQKLIEKYIEIAATNEEKALTDKEKSFYEGNQRAYEAVIDLMLDMKEGDRQ